MLSVPERHPDSCAKGFGECGKLQPRQNLQQKRLRVQRPWTPMLTLLSCACPARTRHMKTDWISGYVQPTIDWQTRVRKAACRTTILLRNDTISVNSHASTRSWLASADDGSQSGAINNEDPSGAQTIPKPGLISEIRGSKGITAAAMQILARSNTSAQPHSKYPAEMVRKACRNFERFYELSEGEAYEEWIDQHSMKVPDLSMADITDHGEIDQHKKRREDCGLDRGCSSVSNYRCLIPRVERVKPGLNVVSPTEWVLIDAIADSGACETVMPKNLCFNITLR